jgi:hypothetical protein
MLAVVFAAEAGARSPGLTRPQPPELSECTISLPETHTTIEAKIAYASDFCEMASQALAGEVFRSPLTVTPGRLWHYNDGAVSCRLRFRRTPAELTIRNAPAACRWFTQPRSGWRLEP